MSDRHRDVSSGATAALRAFNRSFTPRIGVLDESFLGTGRPLAVARLLFEIGLGDASVHQLRRRLGLDSGYFSRLLRHLEDDDLIVMQDDPIDRRRRLPGLTAAGRTEWQLLDERSDTIARVLLETLDAEQRQRLLDAMATAERLLRLSTIKFEVVEPTSHAANEAMAAYFAELDVRFVDGFDVDAPSAGHELDRMRAPFGGFVVIDDNGITCGCSGLQRVDLPHIGAQVSEIKRMWLDPSLRGLGLGKRLLARLEQVAADLGHDHVVLDTNGVLTEAIAMYGAAGYETIDRYNDNPYAQHWFSKAL